MINEDNLSKIEYEVKSSLYSGNFYESGKSYVKIVILDIPDSVSELTIPNEITYNGKVSIVKELGCEGTHESLKELHIKAMLSDFDITSEQLPGLRVIDSDYCDEASCDEILVNDNMVCRVRKYSAFLSNQTTIEKSLLFFPMSDLRENVNLGDISWIEEGVRLSKNARAVKIKLKINEYQVADELYYTENDKIIYYSDWNVAVEKKCYDRALKINNNCNRWKMAEVGFYNEHDSIWYYYIGELIKEKKIDLLNEVYPKYDIQGKVYTDIVASEVPFLIINKLYGIQELSDMELEYLNKIVRGDEELKKIIINNANKAMMYNITIRAYHVVCRGKRKTLKSIFDKHIMKKFEKVSYKGNEFTMLYTDYYDYDPGAKRSPYYIVVDCDYNNPEVEIPAEYCNIPIEKVYFNRATENMRSLYIPEHVYDFCVYADIYKGLTRVECSSENTTLFTDKRNQTLYGKFMGPISEVEDDKKIYLIDLMVQNKNKYVGIIPETYTIDAYVFKFSACEELFYDITGDYEADKDYRIDSPDKILYLQQKVFEGESPLCVRQSFSLGGIRYVYGLDEATVEPGEIGFNVINHVKRIIINSDEMDGRYLRSDIYQHDMDIIVNAPNSFKANLNNQGIYDFFSELMPTEIIISREHNYLFADGHIVLSKDGKKLYYAESDDGMGLTIPYGVRTVCFDLNKNEAKFFVYPETLRTLKYTKSLSADKTRHYVDIQNKELINKILKLIRFDRYAICFEGSTSLYVSDDGAREEFEEEQYFIIPNKEARDSLLKYFTTGDMCDYLRALNDEWDYGRNKDAKIESVVSELIEPIYDRDGYRRYNYGLLGQYESQVEFHVRMAREFIGLTKRYGNSEFTNCIDTLQDIFILLAKEGINENGEFINFEIKNEFIGLLSENIFGAREWRRILDVSGMANNNQLATSILEKIKKLSVEAGEWEDTDDEFDDI